MILRTTFSAQLLFLTLLGCTAAYTTPTTQCTNSCNPISRPSSQELVPVAKPYAIVWNPTSSGTVTILLLRGPSTNILPLYSIAEKIANNGAYTWTPSADLEADISHYGLQLINDSDGTFQWSTQFGISNASSGNASSPALIPTSTGSHGPRTTLFVTSTRHVILQTPSSTQQTTTMSAIASTPSPLTGGSPANSDAHFLSLGVKAALGVGVTVLTLGLITFAILAILRRRRRAKRAGENTTIPMDGQHPWKSLD